MLEQDDPIDVWNVFTAFDKVIEAAKQFAHPEVETNPKQTN